MRVGVIHTKSTWNLARSVCPVDLVSSGILSSFAGQFAPKSITNSSASSPLEFINYMSIHTSPSAIPTWYSYLRASHMAHHRLQKGKRMCVWGKHAWEERCNYVSLPSWYLRRQDEESRLDISGTRCWWCGVAPVHWELFVSLIISGFDVRKIKDCLVCDCSLCNGFCLSDTCASATCNRKGHTKDCEVTPLHPKKHSGQAQGH